MPYEAIVEQMKTWIRDLSLNPREASSILEEIDGDDLSTEDFAEHLEMFGYPNLAAEITGEPVDAGWYREELAENS